MQYILVEFLDGVQAYQEVCAGSVQRYTDMQGGTLEYTIANRVINPKPQQPIWALADLAIPSTVTPRIITKLQYMNKFTDIELAGLFTAAKTSVALEVWLEKFKAAQEVDLEDPQVQAGLHNLELYGLLVVGRALEIVNA